MPRSKSTTAKVVGYGRSETRIRVVFDGSTYPVSIHVSYLEQDKERLRWVHPAGLLGTVRPN